MAVAVEAVVAMVIIAVGLLPTVVIAIADSAVHVANTALRNYALVTWLVVAALVNS